MTSVLVTPALEPSDPVTSDLVASDLVTFALVAFALVAFALVTMGSVPSILASSDWDAFVQVASDFEKAFALVGALVLATASVLGMESGHAVAFDLEMAFDPEAVSDFAEVFDLVVASNFEMEFAVAVFDFGAFVPDPVAIDLVVCHGA